MKEDDFNRDHLYNVIEFSLILAKDLYLDYNIVYTIAMYHEATYNIFYDVNTDNNFDTLQVVKNDAQLKIYFTEPEINIIASAVKENEDENNREKTFTSLYSKVISDADSIGTVRAEILFADTWRNFFNKGNTNRSIFDMAYDFLKNNFQTMGKLNLTLKASYQLIADEWNRTKSIVDSKDDSILLIQNLMNYSVIPRKDDDSLNKMVKKTKKKAIADSKSNLTQDELEDNDLNESYIFNEKDIYQNMDNWKKEKGKNVLFITGLSGSGKTTLGESLEKEYSAFLFEIDGVEHGYDSTNKGIITKVKEQFPQYKKLMDTKNDKNSVTREERVKILNDACKEAMTIIKNDYRNLYIVEGIQIFEYWDGLQLGKDTPLIIKGTSMLKSIWQRWKRNGGGKVDIIAELKNEFPQLFSFYLDSEKKLKDFKDKHTESLVYENLNENFQQEFPDVKQIVDTLDKKDLSYICNGTSFKDSPYVIYRYVYKEKNIPIGFIDAYQLPNDNKDEAQLVLAIKPGYRGKGISKILVSNAIDNIERKNIKRLIWKCDISNTISYNLAKSLGFKYEKKEKTKYIFHMDLNKNLNEDISILDEAKTEITKRKKIENLILKVISALDISGINVKKYKDFFASMNDQQFNKYMKAFLKNEDDNFYLEILPNKNEPSLKQIKYALDILKVPSDEYVYLRHDGHKDTPIRTAYKVPTGYITVKRVQQTLSKKNTYSLDIAQRNQKTGQVTGHDRIAKISDIESYSLVAIGADNALKEFLGPRADNSTAKTDMYKDISLYGYSYLKDMGQDITENQTLNTMYVYLMGAGLGNDLLKEEGTPEEILQGKLNKMKKR